MRQEALALLESRWARSLVGEWAVTTPVGDVRELAEATGISDLREVARIKNVLLKAGIIYPDGGVDQAAAQYVSGVAIAKLPKLPKTKKEKNDADGGAGGE